MPEDKATASDATNPPKTSGDATNPPAAQAGGQAAPNAGEGSSVGQKIGNVAAALNPAQLAEQIKNMDVSQVAAMPKEMLLKIKDIDLSAYGADVAEKVKALKLTEHYKNITGGLQKAYEEKFQVAKAIMALQKKAIEAGASDIFLASGSKPSIRVHGKTTFLEDQDVLETTTLQRYLSEVMSKSDQEKLQGNLEHDFSLTIEGGYRFRVNAFAQKNGISITMRTIPSNIPSFEELDLPDSLQKVVDMPSGLVLVTGSTGSGKSTTLAAIIDLINKKYKKHILTIEDPIEFVHESAASLVEQREVGSHSKSFANALRSALREAPDVILVGEMRDLETISLAVTAAETGALVLGTLHSNSASSAVNRLIDVFPSGQQAQIRTQLSESLQAIVWQTLLPNTQANGRVAAFEVLFNNTAVANLIRDNKTYQLESVLETGQNEGMIAMKNMIAYLLKEGKITEDVAREELERRAT